jgi:hypothetical protein
MFNATTLMRDEFVKQLREGFYQTYGGQNPNYQDIIAWAGNMAIEYLANSDALYHDVEHTILVTLVGQEILRGKQICEGGVTMEDWLHCLLSLCCHDIGYIKGVCQKDRPEENKYHTGIGDQMVELPYGATDASLAPYHIDRGKEYIDKRFKNNSLIDVEIVKRNIELTRFPVPDEADKKTTDDYPGLVRAADLIGQLSDIRYLNKISALYYEFEEIGTNEKLGYFKPGDLRKKYSHFYWDVVSKYIKDGIRYLSVTQEGRMIISSLYSNVFTVEHEPGYIPT